jgi:hypothetical protein
LFRKFLNNKVILEKFWLSLEIIKSIIGTIDNKLIVSKKPPIKMKTVKKKKFEKFLLKIFKINFFNDLRFCITLTLSFAYA